MNTHTRIIQSTLLFVVTCSIASNCGQVTSDRSIPSESEAQRAHVNFKKSMVGAVEAYYDLNDILIKKWNKADDRKKAELLAPARGFSEKLTKEIVVLQRSTTILLSYDENIIDKITPQERPILEGHLKLMEKAQMLCNSIAAYNRVSTQLLKEFQEKSSGTVAESEKVEWFTTTALPMVDSLNKLKIEIDKLIVDYNKLDQERPR